MVDDFVSKVADNMMLLLVITLIIYVSCNIKDNSCVVVDTITSQWIGIMNMFAKRLKWIYTAKLASLDEIELCF